MSDKYYQKLGLKVGLEIHWELDTKRKLFCKCEPHQHPEKSNEKIIREHVAVPGETGEIDSAAIFEIRKNKKTIYEIYRDCICEIETDSAPPYQPDPEALSISFTIARLLNAKIMDEIHIMRKTIVDGSLPSGFQRTMLIANSGNIKLKKRNIKIENMSLEEDSGRLIEINNDITTFRLDRLGIAEIEVGTSPEIYTPEMARDTAELIGKIMKTTRKIKKGLGTVRQDVNVSIKEVERQLGLIQIKNKLEKMNASKSELENDLQLVDVSDVFNEAESKLFKNKKIYGIKFYKLKGILKEVISDKKTFGEEISDRIKKLTGLPEMVNTDELLKSEITKNEKQKLYSKIDADENDLIILGFGDKQNVKNAFNEVRHRIYIATMGIPKEVRKVCLDGTSVFLRPMPSSARMYPETDCIPLIIKKDFISDIEKNLPELPHVIEKRLVEKYKLNKELADQIFSSDHYNDFDKLVTNENIDPILLASIFVNVLPSLLREGIPVKKLNEKHFISIFKALKDSKISKEAIPEILKETALDNSYIDNILKREIINEDELRIFVNKIVNDNQSLIESKGDNAVKPIMGIVMKEMRGKYDGQLIFETVKEILEKYNNK